MDKKRSFLNVATAMFFRVLLLILAMFTKRYLIRFVGNDANGIGSLFLSILGILSIAELGVGTAISFSLYKPITEGDNQKVSAIYHLYVKIYRIIGLVIFVCGLCLMPALPLLSKDYSSTNLHLNFLIFLLSVVIEYFFSAKISLINAYKNNYITTTIWSISQIVQYALEIFVLFAFKSLTLYFFCKIISTCLYWILVEICFNKQYKEIVAIKAKVDKETKKEITKNVKAMFVHKIGSALTNSIDSIIISAFLGVSLLGSYSNYTIIMTSMVNIIALFFTPLTSIVGHLCATESEESQKKHFKFLYMLNFIIGIIFFLGYYAVIDDVVAIFFGGSLTLAKRVSFVITLNYFIQFMKESVLLFRDASGIFYNDRYKPLIEGIINVVLSIIFVKFLGIEGVLIATIITNLLITHIVEPYVLYKHTFKDKPYKFYLLNYSLIAIFTVLLVVLHFVMQNIANAWLELLVNGFIAVGIGLVPVVCVFIFSKSFRTSVKSMFSSFVNKLKKKK